jgi:hypothetical protein
LEGIVQPVDEQNQKEIAGEPGEEISTGLRPEDKSDNP